jgi:hypothetical protein
MLLLNNLACHKNRPKFLIDPNDVSYRIEDWPTVEVLMYHKDELSIFNFS